VHINRPAFLDAGVRAAEMTSGLNTWGVGVVVVGQGGGSLQTMEIGKFPKRHYLDKLVMF